MRNRAQRCEHKFYAGLCTVKGCVHWDGAQTAKEISRTIKHDAWGREQRKRKHRAKVESGAS